MSSSTTIRNNRPPAIPTTCNPVAGQAFPIGTPVINSLDLDAVVIPGNAITIDTAGLVGLAAGTGIPGSNVFVQYLGPLRLTVDQWDSVISGGSPGGLVRGRPYYLVATNVTGAEGKISLLPHLVFEDQVIMQVGVALSATELLILLSAPVPT